MHYCKSKNGSRRQWVQLKRLQSQYNDVSQIRLVLVKAIKDLFNLIKSRFPIELKPKQKKKAIFSYRYSDDYAPIYKYEKATKIFQFPSPELLGYESYISRIGFTKNKQFNSPSFLHFTLSDGSRMDFGQESNLENWQFTNL